MRYFIIMLFLVITFNVAAQESITFNIEELSKPKELLEVKDSYEIFNDIIIKRVDIKRYPTGFPVNVLTHSKLPKELVSYGHNSLFNGMYSAYASHRPFVISPDMIWLLVSQGFSHHINLNSDQFRDELVRHEDVKQLVVYVESLSDDWIENCDWDVVIDGFSEQIKENTKGDISNILECDFTTTTQAEKIASQITIMNVTKSYFDYLSMRIICGIPSITLEGSTEDWELLLKKTKSLSQYDLKWWTKEIIPIIKEITEATKGSVDKDFWRGMFKEHDFGKCGKPNIFDGWIVKFYPYDRDGNRNGLEELHGLNNLPDEIVTVPVVAIDSITKEVCNLELQAGFIGLEQNNKTFALRPKIGWFVNEVLSPEEIVEEDEFDRLVVKVQDGIITESVFKKVYIKNLVIDGYIKTLPEEVNDIKIDTISLHRLSFLDSTLLPRLKKLLPNTHINSY